MLEKTTNLKSTIIVFFPFRLKNIHRCFLEGDLEFFDNYVKIFFTTKVFETCKPKTCISLFNKTNWDGDETQLKLLDDWIYVEINKNVLTLKKLKIKGEFQNFCSHHIIWINYDFNIFSQCEILPSGTCSVYSDKSYFKYVKEKISEKIYYEEQRNISKLSQIKNMLISVLSAAILKFSDNSLKQLPFTKYFNVALHADNYLSGFAWAAKSVKNKKKFDVKVMNFLLSVLLDMLLGILFLNWLNSKISLDSSPTLFLFTTESIVNSIKDLINWLRGDPAGLKLNWAFNKVLATFFLFHIDIWWTFIAYLKPVVKIIFQIFLRLGLLGFTFQASITADLLALVSFHVYCIYAYAAKLYSIQISSLISLWRLFLGRKKNPLRRKVDSCRYSPEQLFVGTLGFTILLFLLPTALLYYIVFTCIRLLILMMQAILMLIRHLNQALPVYSTILWLIRSPKISVGIELIPENGFLKSDIILMNVKPVSFSWWETVCYFMPDCVPKPGVFNNFLLLRAFFISSWRKFPIHLLTGSSVATFATFHLLLTYQHTVLITFTLPLQGNYLSDVGEQIFRISIPSLKNNQTNKKVKLTKMSLLTELH